MSEWVSEWVSDRVPFECFQKPMARLRHLWAEKVDEWYEFNQTREIIQNIKQLLLERSREILCWPVKEPLSLFKTNWNSLASLPIVSLNLRARCVKSVAKLVNRLLFSIVWRKYCLLNWGQIYIVLSLHRILITVQSRGITAAKEVPANLKKKNNDP